MLNKKSKFDNIKDLLKMEWEDYQAVKKKHPKHGTVSTPNPLISFNDFEEFAKSAGEWQPGRRKLYLDTLLSQRVLSRPNPRAFEFEILPPGGWLGGD